MSQEITDFIHVGDSSRPLYISDVDKSNPKGTNGVLPQCFAELLQSMKDGETTLSNLEKFMVKLI